MALAPRPPTWISLALQQPFSLYTQFLAVQLMGICRCASIGTLHPQALTEPLRLNVKDEQQVSQEPFAQSPVTVMPLRIQPPSQLLAQDVTSHFNLVIVDTSHQIFDGLCGRLS